MRTRQVAWLAVAAIALTGAQDRPAPPQAGNDTVVTGKRDEPGIDLSGPVPRLHGGLWVFDRTGTMVSGQPINAPRQRFPGAGGGEGRPFSFRTCLEDDDLAGALRRMAGEHSSLPDPQHCGRLQLAVGKGRVSGRRMCELTSFEIGQSHSRLSIDVSGTYDAQRLRLTMTGNEGTDGFAEGYRSVPRPATWRWRVTASRVGACPDDRRALRGADETVDLIFLPGVDGSGI